MYKVYDYVYNRFDVYLNFSDRNSNIRMLRLKFRVHFKKKKQNKNIVKNRDQIYVKRKTTSVFADVTVTQLDK